jgi:putative selenium metabolism protein SsnA
MSEKIIACSTIYTNDNLNPVIDTAAVVIKNELIADVGKTDDIVKKYPHADVENLGDGIMTPGLVNLHHHLYSSLARGWSLKGAPPENFPQVLDRIWWKLDKALQLDDIYYSAVVGLCDSIRMGITSVIDHHASQNNIIGSLDMIAKAFSQTGLKGSICFEMTDRGGNGIFEKGLKESIAALEKWPAFSKDVNLTAMAGLHASMTLSDDSLKRISEAAKNYNAGYHFHLAEDKSDQDDAFEKYGLRATERFAKHGMLGDKSLAIHGIHLENDEIKLLGDTGTNLVLCPRSNQNNAVGFARWWEYEGVNIGIGTDGIGSDMINEAKSALYISHHVRNDPGFGFSEIINMLLTNNPTIFEKVTGMKVGKISPGYRANIVFWKYQAPTPVNAENIGGHYLYGLYDHQADSVWVDGKKILAEGEFSNLDYGKIAARAQAAAKNLWERI